MQQNYTCIFYHYKLFQVFFLTVDCINQHHLKQVVTVLGEGRSNPFTPDFSKSKAGVQTLY